MLKLIMLVLLMASSAHAAEVLKTFTTHSVASDNLLVKRSDGATMTVTGSFVGKVQIQRSYDSKNFVPYGPIISATGVTQIAPADRDALYRVFCTTHTSGSIGVRLANRLDILLNLQSTAAGVNAFRVTDKEVQFTATSNSTATANGSMCIAGSFASLPTAGFQRGCLAYQVSDNTLYVSTKIVTALDAWKPVW